uniref:NADH-ubiquinone oxidoreductase chain 3 n=1 Tax=Anoplocephala perfoliata TaxID=218192 RepID=A0A0N7DIF3_9CEST|nr:NADH dehydrogenase subunit 3 [Anoplocephala perfoliata]AKU46910.1 NADH dehydrogenase subunit 3 [Anoplocephala perfoliata]
MNSLIFGFVIFGLLFFIIYFFTSGVFNKLVVSVVSWGSPYECGFCSNSLSLNCFSFTYFSLLVFFVIFDLEISLLLNMPEQGLLFYNFYFYYLFIGVLAVGFLFEIWMGYVHWGY